MSPFEARERRTGNGTAGDGRDAIEPWQPDHYAWEHVVALGAAVGLVGGYLGLATGSAFLAFGIAAASLLFLSLGHSRIPITHHMALPASIAALGLAAQDPRLAILGGAVFGILGALVGEIAQRLLYAHADTYFDPSFVSILATSLLLALLATAGLLDASAIPYPVL
jgi:hypothetical protein